MRPSFSGGNAPSDFCNWNAVAALDGDFGQIAGKWLDPDSLSVRDLKDRFLFTQSLEAAPAAAV